MDYAWDRADVGVVKGLGAVDKMLVEVAARVLRIQRHEMR